MSSQELVNAFVEGRISRRTLIRRLTAGGMGLAAAASYAHLLAPERAIARLGTGGHFDLQVSLVKEPLQKVVARERIKVRVQTAQALNIFLRVRLLRPENTAPYRNSILGTGQIQTFDPVVATISVPLDQNPPHSVNALRGRRKARILVDGSASHAPQASDYANLDEAVFKRK